LVVGNQKPINLPNRPLVEKNYIISGLPLRDCYRHHRIYIVLANA
jgi:hypothetical protein